MGRLISKLEHILAEMKGLSPYTDYLLFQVIVPLLRWTKFALSPHVAGSFAISLALTAISITTVLGGHVLLNLPRSRRAKVFISFQHEREHFATAVATAMEKFGLNREKLPFVENPDHDTLLDEIVTAIEECDVFVCIPGDRYSFVDNEVAMAFGLKKPLLFVLGETENASVPDSAKKGYPVFALSSLEREGFRTLANFCSYLAADWRSTVRLYTSVFRHMATCASLGVVAYLVIMTLMTLYTKASSSGETTYQASAYQSWDVALSDSTVWWLVAPGLFFFLVPYAFFTLTRWNLRRILKRAISGKKFREEYLPKTLDYSLSRKGLMRVLFAGQISAHHELRFPPV